MKLKILFPLCLFFISNMLLGSSTESSAPRTVLININNCWMVSMPVNHSQFCGIFDSSRSLECVTSQQQQPTLTTLIIAPPGLAHRSAKILFVSKVSQNSEYLHFKIVDIPSPFPLLNSTHGVVTKLNGGVQLQLKGFVSIFTNLAGLLYDYTNQHLYLFHSYTHKYSCQVFLLIDKGENDFNVEFLYSFNVHSAFMEVIHWSNNPYRQMFYYQKSNEKITELYAIPYYALVVSLKTGTEGVLVSRIASTGLIMQVVDDHIHVTILNEPSSLFISLTNASSPIETCLSAHPSRNNSLFALSGWELCKLRDGSAANRTICEAEQTEKSLPFIFRIKWLHVVIITLVLFFIAMVLVLVCLYCQILGRRGIRQHYNFSSFMMSARDDDEEFLDNTL